MLEPVKVMIDEQTKLTLRQLQDVFADLLAPLKQLETLSGDDDAQKMQKIEDELRRLSTRLDDAVEDQTRKIDAVAASQEEIFSKVAAIADLQGKLISKGQSKAGAVKKVSRKCVKKA